MIERRLPGGIFCRRSGLAGRAQGIHKHDAASVVVVTVENTCRSVITAMPEHATDPVNDRWSLPLEDHPAMSDVRRWVRQRLGGIASDDKLQDIMLVVVELVTNAETHTHSPKILAISRWRDTVRIEVTDGDSTLPVLRPRSATRSSGRGIYLVDAVSADWGVQQYQEGKCVWSVFRCVAPKS